MGGLRDFYLDWPHEVSIETFTKCNARCNFCPSPVLERTGTKMADDLIDAIIEELKDHPWPFMLSPFKVNEPFLDKRLIPICRKVNERLPKAHLRLFTNGSALTQRNMEEVAGLERVVHLWISLNEHEAGPYRELMGLDFERTCTNLDTLHALKAAGGFGHDVVVSKVREAHEPTDRDLAFCAFVNARWPLFSNHLIKRDGWLGYVEPGSPEIPDTGCGRWFELSIMATGKVSLCCMDGTGEHSIGDIRDGVFAVYNAPHWRERRAKSLSRREIHPCSTCTY
jgi:hypothetical protein